MDEILIDSKPSNFHMKRTHILWFIVLILILATFCALSLYEVEIKAFVNELGREGAW